MMYLLHSFTGVLRGSISVFVDEELTQTDRLTAVWGHMLTQLSGSMVVMSPQRGVFRGKCVLGSWVVEVVMRGGEGRGRDGELLACGLVHHHSGAISCKIYHLT